MWIFFCESCDWSGWKICIVKNNYGCRHSDLPKSVGEYSNLVIYQNMGGLPMAIYDLPAQYHGLFKNFRVFCSKLTLHRQTLWHRGYPSSPILSMVTWQQGSLVSSKERNYFRLDISSISPWRYNWIFHQFPLSITTGEIVNTSITAVKGFLRSMSLVTIFSTNGEFWQ